MESYNFWQDVFDTYQSLPDWLKALWLIVPPAFALGSLALVARMRTGGRPVDRAIQGELIYSIRRDDKDQLQIVRHSRQLGSHPALLLLVAQDDPERI
jgi:hypothetical protein